MNSQVVSKVIGGLDRLQSGLVSLSRLRASGILAAESLPTKLKHAHRAYTAIKLAQTIQVFAYDYFRARHPRVSWLTRYRPDNLGLLGDRLLEAAVQRAIDGLQGQVVASGRLVGELARNNTLLAPVQDVAASVLQQFPSIEPTEPVVLEPNYADAAVEKVLSGPQNVGFDEAFKPTYSLLQTPVPSFGDTIRENVPYFWGLAIRESLAAELCALSSIEYDGLPIEFYADMAKQSWDEMRHSKFFFDEACKMLPELRDNLERDDPLLANIAEFMSSGKGLPIPKERNLYEAILNANLAERLILLHRDTETPGILRIKEKINSRFCSNRPWLAEALSIVLRDEVTHSSFGSHWLEYLVPDEKERDDVIVRTELLRGVYLLTSFAHHNNAGLSELLRHYASGRVAPVSGIMGSAKSSVYS